MSDLFEGEHGIAVHSKKLVQAYDALTAAETYARACIIEEVWRFAPDPVDRIEMEWVDDFDSARLYLRAMKGDGFLMEDVSDYDVDEGRRWDAIDSLVAGLAESWYVAESNFFTADGEENTFYLDRPRFTE